MKKKILVTGGTGYIGSHTVVELVNTGYDVVIVDNLYNSELFVLDSIRTLTGSDVVFEKVDCTDITAFENLFKDHKFDAVIHFAAYKAVGESVEKPLSYYHNNITSLINVLELMLKYGVPNIVFSSSCTVYGQPDVLPVTDDAPRKQALSPYGNSKIMCEDILTDTVKANETIKVISLRYFNPIGAHSSSLLGELPKGVPNNLLPYITQTAAGIRECLSVFGDNYNTPDGTPIRDYIDVVDLADAHVVALERMVNGKTEQNFEHFNIGTGNGVSVLELVHAFENAINLKLNYKIAPARAGDVEAVWADASKANQILGWKAKTPLDQTLRNAWAWEQHLRNDK